MWDENEADWHNYFVPPVDPQLEEVYDDEDGMQADNRLYHGSSPHATATTVTGGSTANDPMEDFMKSDDYQWQPPPEQSQQMPTDWEEGAENTEWEDDQVDEDRIQINPCQSAEFLNSVQEMDEKPMPEERIE